jgi:hypothetical protein
VIAVRRGLDRYPLNSPWLRAIVARHWLKTWFAVNSIVAVAYQATDTSLLFFDARLYLEATRAWLDGADPWAVQLAGNYFAAPPPSLLPLAPLALLPADLGVAIVAALVIAGAVATVRLLHLPWWWILFPPLVQCVLSANVHGLLVPLILVRGGALAVILKVYAAIPLAILGRWRALAVTVVILVATIPLLPWAAYLSNFGAIAAHLAEQTKHHIPLALLAALAPFVAVALSIIGRERAAWLAPLALWPSQQYYYGTLVMPARSTVAAAIVAVPVTGSGLLAVAVLAVVAWRGGVRPRWPTRAGYSDPDGTISAVTAGTGSVDSQHDRSSP